MQLDESYRPYNLIIGGGGRGVRVALKQHGTGEWVCVSEEGDPVGAVWMKRSAVEMLPHLDLGCSRRILEPRGGCWDCRASSARANTVAGIGTEGLQTWQERLKG